MRSLLADPAQPTEPDDLIGLYQFPADRRWVRGMFVSSADGAVQGGSGTSGSLSTPGDRSIFALQRSLCDVILVGAGTARTEGYLPVRPGEVDTDLRRRLGLRPVPPIAVVTRSPDRRSPTLQGGLAPSIVITVEDAEMAPAEEQDIRVIRAGQGAVDLSSALAQLADLGHRRVVCEGGPSLLAQVAAIGRLDELCLTIAPSLLAGASRRLLDGPALDPPLALSLAHLLEEDGALFARYVVDRAEGRE